MFKHLILLFLFCLVIGGLPSHSSAGKFQGYVAVENRIFVEAPKFSGQDMNNGPTLIAEPEYYHVTSDNKNTFTLKGYAHIDPYDDKRNHWDIRQLDWLRVQGDWELRAGASSVFWGVTESNHLVDIINQTDAVEGSDGEDKLGQPMIQLGVFKSWGDLRLYYLPYFRERTFAGRAGRLRGEKPVETDLTTYDSNAKRWNPDIAVRYSNSFGDWDVGISHFSGTSREASFIESTNGDGEAIFNPHYDIIDQTGTDIQYTKEGWLWKLEAITRTGHGRRFVAATGGAEYTFYSIAGSNMDLGVLSEYQFDDRSGQAPGTFADNDVFAGLRLTLNDIQDTAILGGASIDNNTQAMFFFLEGQRRVGNNWKVEVEARLASNVKDESPESGFNRDGYAQLRLARYF